MTFEELLRISIAQGDPVYVNQSRVALYQALVALARVDEARAMARDIIEYSSRVGDRRAEHSGVHHLADCALIEGDCPTSLGLYRRSLDLAESIGDRIETGFEVEGIAMALAGLGEHERPVVRSAAMRAEWARHDVADYGPRIWPRW